MESPTHKKVILASNSPRRRQLLKEIVPEFSIAPSRDVDESFPATLKAYEVAPFLSRLKADAYSDLADNDTVIITADTVVIVDDDILGKPHNAVEAEAMLKKLSGRGHKVMTGVTLKSADKSDTFVNTTEVFFDKLSDNEISAYIEEFRPFDKAGSYGIQEWIGCRGIKSIYGCFYNVMGLPLNDLFVHLKHFS